jgi:hypothetical protein
MTGHIEENIWMTRLLKLVLMSALVGTLGLVGCGDDTVETGTGGSGTGGSGTGGTAGNGGGGTPADVCSMGPLAETGQTASGELSCVATLPFDLTVTFNATPTGTLQQGENEFDLQLEFAIAAETINTIVDLASEATLTGAEASITATTGDTGATTQEVVDEGVPCTLLFERDTDTVVVTTVSQGTFTLDEGSTLELTLESLTQAVTALGIPVVLTTEGTEPSCEFVGDMPSVSFSLEQ